MLQILHGALGQLVTLVMGALATAVIAAFPRIWTYLGAKIHGERVLVLRGTLASGAALVFAKVKAGDITVDAAVSELVAYVKKSMPEILAAMKMEDAHLTEMAISAYYIASQQPPPAPASP